ncbi:hypothetical protein JTE90_024332 [Oedothorax gibbosus]|uniref:Hexosyltransferase n=1 Tax=Oedothorax gibbosus TaxID=931172 RepID=A0AAV6VZA5_9ARAC|nr:hypothetical protein JTE90_024332 [Oedothorax gibbosus]
MQRHKLFRSSSIRIKSHQKLRTLFASMIGIIFIFVICSEFYIGKHAVRILNFYNNQTQPSNREGFLFSIRNKIIKLQNIGNSIQEKIESIEVSDFDEYHKFLVDARINANKTFFFFNDTKTFHKLFQTWLNSRSMDNGLEIDFKLNHRHLCFEQGRAVPILIAVTSSATHLESRAAIRETWGGYAKEKGAVVVFFLGLPKNPKYHSRVFDENSKFHDIVQANFIDTYTNLTMKTISVLKWMTEVCSLAKYILKVDDDMFINIDNFLNITESKNESKTIMGELAHDWPPVRSAKNKWYTSYNDYPFSIYPDFVFGPSYLLTGDSAKSLYEESLKLNLFRLEDVYVTGFVAEKAQVKRSNLPAMFNTPRDLQPCNFRHLLSSHGHTPPDIRRHWMWLTRRNFKCEP